VPHELIDDYGLYKPVHLGVRHRRRLEKTRERAAKLLNVDTRNIGWHGNAILIKKHVGVLDCAAVDLPTLEPRGAVIAELLVGDRPLRVVGMHLDLSGLWRRRQMRAILEAIAARPQVMPTVLMGDTNEWRTERGCLHGARTRVPHRADRASFDARHPVAALDRISSTRAAASKRQRAHEARRRGAPRTTCRHLGKDFRLACDLPQAGGRWIDEADSHRLAVLTTVRRCGVEAPGLLSCRRDGVSLRNLGPHHRSAA
jgi:hypothetical protein